MGLFDGHITDIDWNGNGKIDSWDDGMFLNMVQMQMDDESREDRISRMTDAITRDGVSKQIGNEEFAALCEQEGLNMDDFDQSDINEIQRRLNRF